MTLMVSLGELTPENLEAVLETLESLGDGVSRIEIGPDTDNYLNPEEEFVADMEAPAYDDLLTGEDTQQQLAQAAEERDHFYRKYVLAYEDFQVASAENYQLRNQIMALEGLYQRQLIENYELGERHAALIEELNILREDS